MAAVMMDQGLQDFLTDLIAGSHFSAMKCRLYSNNHTPANTDVLANYTEATFSGYSAVTPSGWSGSSVSAHVASSVAADATFTLTSGSQAIYGVYLTDSANSRLYAAQIDPNAPVTLNTTVTTYVVSVTVSLQGP